MENWRLVSRWILYSRGSTGAKAGKHLKIQTRSSSVSVAPKSAMPPRLSQFNMPTTPLAEVDNKGEKSSKVHAVLD